MKKLFSLVINLIWVPFICLPLTRQTVAASESGVVEAHERRQPEKRTIHKEGEMQVSGKMRLKILPDSIIRYTPDGKRQYKTVHKYDADGHEVLCQAYEWENGAWVNSYRYVYAYNAVGHETLYESYHWENGRWTGDYKSTSEFDHLGKEISLAYYNWNNGRWMKRSENYADRKHIGAKIWFDANLLYSENGGIEEKLFYIQNSGLEWAMDHTEMGYEPMYDSNNNLTMVETTVLQDGKKVPYRKYVLKHGSNNRVLIEVYEYRGNKSGEKMTCKASNTYDARGNLIQSESYGLVNNKWIGQNKSFSTYDAKGNVLFHESHSWDHSAGDWVASYKHIRKCDAKGNELFFESYYWDTSLNDWLRSFRSERTYDANGNELSGKFYHWDASRNDWIRSSSSKYMYDVNGNELYWEYFDWDISTGNLIGGSKTICEKKSRNGDPVLYKSYEMNGNSWIPKNYIRIYSSGISSFNAARF